MISPEELTSFAKAKAESLGFALCGVTGALPRRQTEFYDWWVNMGFGAGMNYLRTQKNRRKHIKALVPGANSVVVCAMRFPGGASGVPADSDSRAYGKIARYALHSDYHDRILPLLEDLALALDGAAGTRGARAYIDTGPLSERAFASRAGVGWVGKHSLLINREEGSWLWLGEVITAAKLAPDAPAADHCGKCRRCLDACPTGAIVEDLRTVDSRKCLSYWNIEHRGAIPGEFHKPMGDWLLGCDICQEVCPWNAQSERVGREAPPVEYVAADDLLALTPEQFAERYRGRAVARAKLEGLQRNAKIVKKNFEGT
ncbi:MAG: tRNA epoxyqueuosine(34) reductase QueG [Bdellovibrionota bacterium]